MLSDLFWWAKRAAIIGIALAAAYFYARWQGERVDHVNTRTAAATAALKSASEVAIITQQLQRDKDHALTQATKRAQSHRADADSARTELDRLRDVIATRPVDPSTNTCAAPVDRASAAAELLGHCAAALTDLAAKADRLHADRMTLWEAWPRPMPAPD